jgi:hypothetical protein
MEKTCEITVSESGENLHVGINVIDVIKIYGVPDELITDYPQYIPYREIGPVILDRFLQYNSNIIVKTLFYYSAGTERIFCSTNTVHNDWIVFYDYNSP